jgi:hypothetical protein
MMMMSEDIQRRMDDIEQRMGIMDGSVRTMKEQFSVLPHFSDAITRIEATGMGYRRNGNTVHLISDSPTPSELGVTQASARLSGGDWLGNSVAGAITFGSIEHETDNTIIDADLVAGTMTIGVAAIYQVILNGHGRIQVSPTTELGGFTSATVRNELAASLETRIFLSRTHLSTYSRGPFILDIEVASVVNVSLPAGRVLNVYGQNAIVGGSSYGIRDLDFIVNYVCPS